MLFTFLKCAKHINFFQKISKILIIEENLKMLTGPTDPYKSVSIFLLCL